MSLPESIATVFVHGLFSGPKVWSGLVTTLKRDKAAMAGVTLVTFKYDTPRLRLSPLSRIPLLAEVADSFATFLRSSPLVSSANRVVLVGHSFGGLVIQKYLAAQLARGRGGELKRIKTVVLLAVPNTGSEFWLVERRILGVVWRHPHERTTRPYDTELAEVRRIVIEQIVYANLNSESSCHIPFDVYAGARDAIVRSSSAKSVFPRAGTIPGNHSSILKRDGVAAVSRAVASAVTRARTACAEDVTQFHTESLDITNAEDLAAVVRLQHDSFPAHAHMSADDLRRCLSNYKAKWAIAPHAVVAKMNGKVCAFLLYSETPTVFVAGYLCVESGVAGEFITSKIVHRLREHSRESGDKPVLFEVRRPIKGQADRREARARIKLFELYGARVIRGIDYVAPDMSRFPEDAPEPYLLMYGRSGQMPPALSASAVASFVEQMYRVSYECWFQDCESEDAKQVYLSRLLGQIKASINEMCRLEPYSGAG